MTTSTDIFPFTVHVTDDAVADLRERLTRARLARPLPGDDWDLGVPTSYLHKVLSYWSDEFDWRAQEDVLNTVPGFVTEIDGQRIHFLHVRSEVPDATPVVLTHGWPGSVLEFLDVIGPLTDPVAHGGRPEDAFHVVIPSLPGFGFSTPLADSGWTIQRIAAAWAELMDRLGYDRFVAQGGDIGAGVAPEIGRVAPDRVIGVHVNGALGGFVSEVDDDVDLTPLERDRMERVRTFMQSELGYIAMQSTRPGLVGTVLGASPVALLAWIVDKLRAWTWPLEADPDEVLGIDWILANVSLYWFTESAGSAAQVGYATGGDWGAEPASSGVPTAAIQLAHDIGLRHVAEQSNRVVRWTDVTDRGGHFAAMEEPQLLVDDLRAFVAGL